MGGVACSRGGCCLLPGGGVPAPGGGIPACTEAYPSPCEQNDRQVQKYYLGHNFVAAGKKKQTYAKKLNGVASFQGGIDLESQIIRLFVLLPQDVRFERQTGVLRDVDERRQQSIVLLFRCLRGATDRHVVRYSRYSNFVHTKRLRKRFRFEKGIIPIPKNNFFSAWSEQ